MSIRLSSSTGVAWYGPTLHLGGYGNATRAYLRTLLRLGLPVRAVSISGDHSALVDDGSIDVVRALEHGDAGHRPIEIVHFDPGVCGTLGSLMPAARVCATVFETMSIPPSWVRPLLDVDAVWVPTEFHRETYARAGIPRDKIAVVPFAIDTDFFSARAPAQNERFRFVYASVWHPRKGVDVLLRAFIEEFSVDEPVELIVQASIPDKSGKEAQLEALARVEATIGAAVTSGGKRRVEIRTTPLKHSELPELYASSDLYISTDRNNIWTLPCPESLSMGRPCATTDYARATGWLADDNPLLIRCNEELADSDDELLRLRPIYAGQKWATYSPSEVRRVMRWAFSHPADLAALARSGREYVLKTHSIDAVAGALERAIERLPLRHRVRVKPAVARALRIDATQPPNTKPVFLVEALKPALTSLRGVVNGLRGRGEG